MKIIVKMLGSVKKYAEGKINDNYELFLGENISLKELLDYINIPPLEVSVVLVNRVEQKEDYLLRDGDEVIIFSLNCGG